MSESRCFRNRMAVVFMLISLTVAALGFFKAGRETQLQLHNQEEISDAVQSMLDSQDFGYAILRSDGQVVEWNPALERLSGWTKTEVAKGGLHTVIGGDMWAAHCRSFDQAFKEPREHTKTIVVNCEMVSKSGQQIPIRISVRVVEGRHGALYAIAHIDRQADVKSVSYVPPQPVKGE